MQKEERSQRQLADDSIDGCCLSASHPWLHPDVSTSTMLGHGCEPANIEYCLEDEDGVKW